MTNTKTFTVDAVLFDMDGTLTDSIAAVEAAWGKVADDLGLDRSYVIAATHGKRAVDNLAFFRPEIKEHEMEKEVEMFERSILDFADEYNKSRESLALRSRIPSSNTSDDSASSGASTPALSLSNASSGISSRAASLSTPNRPSFSSFSSPHDSNPARRPSFATRLNNMLAMATLHEHGDSAISDDHDHDHDDPNYFHDKNVKEIVRDVEAAWEIEAQCTDRSIRILPGVKEMIGSIPEGRYAVATSGAKTYAYGAMTRVGITPPKITITADDKRLKAGKPAPDPFLLAASCLGFPADRCVVFEDSPSGIKAGVASGAVVIAVCTSHKREDIEGLGAHYVVDDMRNVRCVPCPEGEGALKFFVEC